ncbi:aspartyl glutamyl-trna(asn gln) a subunit [Lasallia pustulata]|uniref:Glutamyl-tRNA(Gln) amidotransferase subunit A, mitochondrial n=1 Tax=Lasallia pustulata TaxID=136370 RepID=A0A1W5DB35_9LECA|nr:aspartyl glutamyl-trna(asn gln) a subunit [Lasallia pustulata]
MSLLRQAERCFKNQHVHNALNAFISPGDHGHLLQAAREADDRTSRGHARSRLDGRLIAVKNNICTAEQATTCASKILNGFKSPYPATVVEKLQAAGAIIAGTTNLDEFGMGSHSTNSAFGPVYNVHGSRDDPLSAGGSSGGSAVAVATGQCHAALGTDTGGSVRLPAAYTGIVGFKPSYGMVSRWGVIAYANSLDTVGILAMDSTSAREVFHAINGYDRRDPTSLAPNTRSRISEQLNRRRRKRSLQIGVPQEYNIDELESGVRMAWISTLKSLQELGHAVKKVSLPATKLALSAYYVIAPAEASSNLAKYDGVRYGNQHSNKVNDDAMLYANTRGQGLGEEVRGRILLGAYSLSAAAIDNYFIQAQKVRRLVQEDFDRVFALPNPLLEQSADAQRTTGVDILISPTAPTLPPKLAAVASHSPVDSYSDDVLTVPASLAGLPALSLPVSIEPHSALVESGPSTVGIQIIAQYGDDDLLFDVAQIIEDGRKA